MRCHKYGIQENTRKTCRGQDYQLSLIHIQMCIRDRYITVHSYILYTIEHVHAHEPLKQCQKFLESNMKNITWNVVHICKLTDWLFTKGFMSLMLRMIGIIGLSLLYGLCFINKNKCLFKKHYCILLTNIKIIN